MLRFEGAGESADREAVQALVEPLAKPAYIHFSRGDPCGHVRFETAESCKAVLDALATLHASCWGRPPRGVWTDETRPPFLRLIADSTLRTIRKRWPDLLSAAVRKS